MMIRHVLGEGVALLFPKSESSVVLTILRVLYNANKQDFLREAIEAIEAENVPKLPLVNYFHLCNHCFRDLDERDPNTYKMTTKNLKGDEDTKWTHYVCPVLKDNRP